MYQLIANVESEQKKAKVVAVRSGDTVKVHQKIQEGQKTRTQIFEGLVIRTRNLGSLNARIYVRRIASGVGVEKSFLLHSPLVEKVEIIKRSKVRRNYLSYMRERTGKSARMTGTSFDKDAVNDVSVPADETKEAKEAQAELDEDKIDELKEEQVEEVKAKEEEAKAAHAKETPLDDSTETEEDTPTKD